MVGQGSGHRYRYYMCSNTRRKLGKVCPSPILPRDQVEEFIIDRIKSYILTEENLEELRRIASPRKSWGFYLSYTPVEEEGDKESG